MLLFKEINGHQEEETDIMLWKERAAHQNSNLPRSQTSQPGPLHLAFLENIKFFTFTILEIQVDVYDKTKCTFCTVFLIYEK